MRIGPQWPHTGKFRCDIDQQLWAELTVKIKDDLTLTARLDCGQDIQHASRF